MAQLRTRPPPVRRRGRAGDRSPASGRPYADRTLLRRCRSGTRGVDSARVWDADLQAEGAIEMSEGATGLEPTIEITEADYPEIMRIVASDGEVDTYLASAGVARRRVRHDADAATARACPSGRRSAVRCSTSSRSARWPTPPSSDGMVTLPVSAATSLIVSVSEVMNEGLRLADCLEMHRIRMPLPDFVRRSSCSGSTTTGCGERSRNGHARLSAFESVRAHRPTRRELPETPALTTDPRS